MDIDKVQLDFNETSITILQFIIATIMYGIALKLKTSDFKLLIKNPKSLILGLTLHYLVVPGLTLFLLSIFDLRASLALGFIIIVACPGGSLANIFTNLARGNNALSIGLNSLTTLLALIAMPFYLIFMARYAQIGDGLLVNVALEPLDILKGIGLILGLPLVLGMITSKNFPEFSQKASIFISKVSFLFLIVFIIGALKANFSIFLDYIDQIVFVSLLHNLIAVGAGFLCAHIFIADTGDRKSITLSSGVRNTALGLGIVFQFFDGLGGTAILVAWWGISQIILGVILSQVWKKSKQALPVNEIEY